MPGVPSLSGGMLLVALADLEKGPPLPRRLDDEGLVADRRRAAARRGAPDRGVRGAPLRRRAGSRASSRRRRAGCTLHCSTIDAEGNAVAYTSSDRRRCSALVAPGHGHRAEQLPRRARHPARAGTRTRRVARMMTSMCPTLVRRGDGRWISLGSAGSDRIRSAILQVLVHVLDGGRPPPGGRSAGRASTRATTRSTSRATAARASRSRPSSPIGLEVEATWAPGFFFGGVQAVAQIAGRRLRRGRRLGPPRLRRLPRLTALDPTFRI